jgi:hypothetical protein
MTKTHFYQHPRINEFIRGWSDVLCIWRLCRSATCFKSRHCHARDARRCFHTHFVLLPPGVQAWMHAIADAHEKELTYDQVIESMFDTEAENALEDWLEAVKYSEAMLKAKKIEWPAPGEV